MEDYVRAALLGLLQALTEFLPVSSSGHLVVAAELFGDKVNEVTFDVGLHLGTTAGVLIYFWRDWAMLVKSTYRDLTNYGAHIQYWHWESRLSMLLVTASLPGLIVGALIELLIGNGLREPWIVGTTLIVGGIAIWIFDALGKQTRQLPDINAPRALLIGLAQAIALVPGISRSGATIAAGRALNLERPVAARFSFLISAPIVLGASAALLGNAIITHENVNWGPLLFGALVAAATSLAVIRGLLTFIQSHSLRLFVWYRLLVGTAVIISAWTGLL